MDFHAAADGGCFCAGVLALETSGFVELECSFVFHRYPGCNVGAAFFMQAFALRILKGCAHAFVSVIGQDVNGSPVAGRAFSFCERLKSTVLLPGVTKSLRADIFYE
ncbi:MAG: hypothetical protein ACK5NE_08200 [Brachymonas sp.]